MPNLWFKGPDRIQKIFYLGLEVLVIRGTFVQRGKGLYIRGIDSPNKAEDVPHQKGYRPLDAAIHSHTVTYRKASIWGFSIRTYLDSQVAGNNRPLHPKVDHYWFKVPQNYEPLALQVAQNMVVAGSGIPSHGLSLAQIGFIEFVVAPLALSLVASLERTWRSPTPAHCTYRSMYSRAPNMQRILTFVPEVHKWADCGLFGSPGVGAQAL